MAGSGIEQFIFEITSVLLVPVLVVALLALVVVLVEAGRVVAEQVRRRRRGLARLEVAASTAVQLRAGGDSEAARRALRPVLSGQRMRAAVDAMMAPEGPVDRDSTAAKVLADFDYASVRALERTRILVRAGPALGLMGTLIPLSPALEALSNGDVARLSQDLRIAFSVTVLGLFVGTVAFAVSLVRDRLYAQDLSDLEYLAAALTVSPPASQSGTATGSLSGAAMGSLSGTATGSPSGSPSASPSGSPSGAPSASPPTSPSVLGTATGSPSGSVPGSVPTAGEALA